MQPFHCLLLFFRRHHVEFVIDDDSETKYEFGLVKYRVYGQLYLVECLEQNRKWIWLNRTETQMLTIWIRRSFKQFIKNVTIPVGILKTCWCLTGWLMNNNGSCLWRCHLNQKYRSFEWLCSELVLHDSYHVTESIIDEFLPDQLSLAGTKVKKRQRVMKLVRDCTVLANNNSNNKFAKELAYVDNSLEPSVTLYSKQVIASKIPWMSRLDARYEWYGEHLRCPLISSRSMLSIIFWLLTCSEVWDRSNWTWLNAAPVESWTN